MDNRSDATAIQAQMAQIRDDLQRDVGDVVDQARELTNWRNFVRTYPWATLSIAAAVGYLVVPQKLRVSSPDAKTLEKLAKEQKLIVEPKPKRAAATGPAGAAFNLLAGLAFRAAMPMIGTYVSGMLESRQPSREGTPAPRSSQA